jgi:hypothetical protein
VLLRVLLLAQASLAALQQRPRLAAAMVGVMGVVTRRSRQ